MSGLFRPRRFDNSHTGSHTSVDDSFTFLPTPHPADELTKNSQYCVVRLPATPTVLQGNYTNPALGEVPLSGYADGPTRCAVLVSPTAINVWRYNSADASPLTFEFPVESPHVAITTRPLPGADDPGLVTIDAISGHTTFYESIHHAPALGLIRPAASETTVPVHVTQGEVIVSAENAEPAGVVVATLWQRVFLVVLRDAAGRPRLSAAELATKPLRLLGLWPRLSRGALDEIVAMRRGRVAPGGVWQELAILHAGGTLRTIIVQASVTGVPAAKRRSASVELAPILENNVDAVLTGASTRFVDVWPWPAGDVYTVLVQVNESGDVDSNGNDGASRYVMVTMRINESGVLVQASHRLPAVTGASRLYIPKPGTTAFVAAGNLVVLVDMDTKHQNQDNNNSNNDPAKGIPYYTPRWEDVVRFRSNVHIYGLGFENGSEQASSSATDHPALVAITDHGVLRLERFPETDVADPVARVASHMQQAMYYSGSLAVDFDMQFADFDDSPETVVAACRNVVASTLELALPYLPAYTSTSESLAARAALLRELLAYMQRNFTTAWPTVLPDLLLALEKVQAAQSVWLAADEHAEAKLRLVDAVQRQGIVADDPARYFFAHCVADILPVLTELAAGDDVPTRTMVVGALHAVVEAERQYGDELRMLWVFNLRLVILAEELFVKTHELCTAVDLVHFADALYFLVTYAIRYMCVTNDDQLDGYTDWYRRRKGTWVNTLLEHGLVADAVRITETYEDFYSLASIINKEKDLRSPEYVADQIALYVDKHGYAFAAKLFDYYLKHDDVTTLLHSPYHAHLEQYFAANPSSTAHVAWIYYLHAQNFAQASRVLMTLSLKEETDNQQNRELNYSLAKLTAIAASETAQDPILRETAIEAENNLVVIRVQNRLYAAVAAFVQDKADLVTLSYFVDNFGNPGMPQDQLRLELEPFFDRFVAQLPLLKEQLVLLLTSVQPKLQFTHVFSDALYVAALIGNDSIFAEQAAQVWLRLLTFTDDWSEINNTADKLDEVNKIKVKETALYTTVKEVYKNKEIMAILDTVIERARESESDDSLYGLTHHLIKSHNLGGWVDTIKSEVQRE